MKEVIIKNDFDHSYLLIEESEIEKNYIFKMLMNNKIPGLLECKIRYIEESSYCAYDITAKRSLEQEYINKKMCFSDIIELFYGINVVMCQAKEYLLDQKGFWLEPAYIFKDLETEEISCLYFPSHKEEFEKQKAYRQLADFLLDKIDHKDEHAVNMAYHFYKISKEEYFSFDSFVNFMEKEALLVKAKERRESVLVEDHTYSIQENSSELFNENVYGFPNEKSEDKLSRIKWWIPGIMFLIGGFLSIGYVCFPLFREYPLFVLLPGLSSIVSASICMIRNILHLYRERCEADYIEPEKPVRVEEYFDDTLDDVTVFFDQEEYLRLKWKEGRFSKEHILDTFPLNVGKLKESVQVFINDSSVSRLHARFRSQGSTLYLQDLDSTNGTFINGKRLVAGEDAIIKRGDEIQFGKIIVNVV